MPMFERNVEVPFDGPDGYTLSGKAEFRATVSWDELDIETDSLIVRVKGEVVGMDEMVENDIINQLYGMSHDIISEMERDRAEYMAEMAHYR